MSILVDKSVKRLKIKVYYTIDEMGREAAKDASERINAVIAEKGTANILFTAAPSQDTFLRYLADSDIDWSKVRAFHMAEYVGLSEDSPQGLGNYLKSVIFDKIHLLETYIINANARDLKGECNRYSQLLYKLKPDVVFLGMDEKGRLTFYEKPASGFSPFGALGFVKLDETYRTQQVSDGCFGGLGDVPAYALTLGMSLMKDIPHVMVIVPGSSRKDAVTDIINSKVSDECPSYILKHHKDSCLYLDTESAGDWGPVVKAREY